MVLARFRATDDKLASQKLLIVEFLHCAFRFVHREHLHEGKTLRALVMPVAYDLGIVHVSYAVEQFEEIALGRVE